MALTIEIKLDRSNKIYYEGELVKGTVQVTSTTETKHEGKRNSLENPDFDWTFQLSGIFISLDGSVALQMSNKNVGIFEAFYNSVKPIQLLDALLELQPAGKLAQGITEFEFEFPLNCVREQRTLYETYHGVFVNILYMLKAEVRKSFLTKNKAVSHQQQFIIQTRPTPAIAAKPVNFSISPETLQKSVKERISIPRFLFTGVLDTTDCCITQPFTGYIQIHHTEVAIKSIEVQLVRVETCGCAEGYSKDSTEVQNIQIADGNVCPKIQIPIVVIFPRLFACPTLITKNFKVEFEINLVILFLDDHLVTENFQIVLHRNN